MHSAKLSYSPRPSDQWRQYDSNDTELLKETALFTEALDPQDFRRSNNVYPKERSITSSSSSSSLSANNTSTESTTPSSSNGSTDNLFETLHKKPPNRVAAHMRKVKRVKRNRIQRVLLQVRFAMSIVFSLPILLLLLSMATFQTAKTYLLDSCLFRKKRPQDHEELDAPDELLTQDETYYADRWGYTSEMHEVLTQDGYILTMYRIFKKGSLPQGNYPFLSFPI
jgi:hypothetical protein